MPSPPELQQQHPRRYSAEPSGVQDIDVESQSHAALDCSPVRALWPVIIVGFLALHTSASTDSVFPWIVHMQFQIRGPLGSSSSPQPCQAEPAATSTMASSA